MTPRGSRAPRGSCKAPMRPRSASTIRRSPTRRARAPMSTPSGARRAPSSAMTGSSNMTQRAWRSDMKPAPSLPLTVLLFALLFLVPAWPWLSGAVTIPYGGQSTFYPPVAFMARSFASGQSPFWSPNIYAGWPMIADPQSLLTSPLHLALALANAAPSVWANDVVTFAYLFLGGLGVILFFHDRGWHRAGALVAALALAFGGSASGRLQHTGQ